MLIMIDIPILNHPSCRMGKAWGATATMQGDGDDRRSKEMLRRILYHHYTRQCHSVASREDKHLHVSGGYIGKQGTCITHNALRHTYIAGIVQQSMHVHNTACLIDSVSQPQQYKQKSMHNFCLFLKSVFLSPGLATSD